MKRTLSLILLPLMLFCLFSCGNTTTKTDLATESAPTFYDIPENELTDSDAHDTTVSLHISCSENQLFNKYDLSVILDGNEIAILKHGMVVTLVIPVSKGSHTLQFHSKDTPAVSGEIAFYAEAQTELHYALKCKRDLVEAEEISPETETPETKAPETKAPETKAPETKAPETEAPETKAPETKAPETKPATPQPPTHESGSAGVTIPDNAETEGNLVWVPVNGGTKYHKNATCSKMKDPIQVTVETAVANGYGPCGRCYK